MGIRVVNLLTTILITWTLSACGGGSSDTASAPVPVVNEKMGGIWEGTSTSGGNSQTLIGVTTDDGRFRFLSLDTSGQFVGTINVSNQNQISGSGVGIAPVGSTWTDGSTAISIDLSGAISERVSFTGTWSASTGEEGDFNLNFDDIYNEDSSISTVQGTWTSFDEFANATGSYTIDSDGGINGQDNSGCVYGGSLSIIDSNFNVYDITLTVSNCGDFNGTYTGLSTFLGTSRSGNTPELLISVDDDNFFVILSVFK